MGLVARTEGEISPTKSFFERQIYQTDPSGFYDRLMMELKGVNGAFMSAFNILWGSSMAAYGLHPDDLKKDRAKRESNGRFLSMMQKFDEDIRHILASINKAREVIDHEIKHIDEAIDQLEKNNSPETAHQIWHLKNYRSELKKQKSELNQLEQEANDTADLSAHDIGSAREKVDNLRGRVRDFFSNLYQRAADCTHSVMRRVPRPLRGAWGKTRASAHESAPAAPIKQTVEEIVEP